MDYSQDDLAKRCNIGRLNSKYRIWQVCVDFHIFICFKQ